MLVKLEVVKEVYQPSEPIMKNGKDSGERYPESWSLLCLDKTEPADCRMEEMVFYKLKPSERDVYYGKTVGKTLTMGVDRITHNKTGSRAMLQGRILPDTHTHAEANGKK